MEKTNQNIEENTTQEVEQNEALETEKNINESAEVTTDEPGEQPKKRFSLAALIVPIAVIVILATFAGVVYYGKVVKPKKDIDKKAGYKVEDYIVINKYTDFDYKITQDVFDECVKEETDYYEDVKRAAVVTDQIAFNYTAYIDGKKIDDISQKDAELDLGADEEGLYKLFSDAILGKKRGDKFEIEADGALANEVSFGDVDYSNKKVLFKVKVTGVSKFVSEKVTDKWVKENYLDEYALENKKDFYDWCKDIIIENAKAEVWQLAVNSATMAGYPQELYDDIVLEFTQDANYYAEQFGMSTEDYLNVSGYTDESLEEEYLNEVKSELVMWYIVKEQRLECSEEDIEAKYEELYYDLGYETVDEMKAEYTKEEITKAVLLEKAQNYVFDHSNIAQNFTIPE